MNNQRTFQEMIKMTRTVIKEFDKVEQKPWGIEGSMIELSKQVGDLAKHVMVQEKYYHKEREEQEVYKTTKENIADELTDLFFMIVRIADHYAIDLEEANVIARTGDMKYFGKEVVF